MEMKILDSIIGVKHPVEFDVIEFINTQTNKLISSVASTENIVVYIDESSNNDNTPFATTKKIDNYYEIKFYKKTVERAVGLLDTQISQKTFLTLLVIHELCHTIITNYSLSDEDYEYLVNSNAINYMHKYTRYRIKNIEKSIERVYKSNKNYYVLKQIFMFPIGKDEYFE